MASSRAKTRSTSSWRSATQMAVRLVIGLSMGVAARAGLV